LGWDTKEGLFFEKKISIGCNFHENSYIRLANSNFMLAVMKKKDCLFSFKPLLHEGFSGLIYSVRICFPFNYYWLLQQEEKWKCSRFPGITVPQVSSFETLFSNRDSGG
jgi:hypothetical protein